MNLPVRNVRGINGADLTPLLQSEVGAFLELIFTAQRILPAAGGPRKQVQPIVLGALLPAHAIAAPLPVEEHLPIGKGFLQAAQALAPDPLILQTAGLAPLVSRLSALLAVHKGYSHLRTDVV